jgi:hypothetical protein
MSTSRYTVRKLGWYQPPHGDPYTRRLPTAEPVARFDTFDVAEMHRRVLEAETRGGENPFRFGGGSVFFQSSLDGPRLHDWLMDAGIDPPASELRHHDWRAWWDSFAHLWSADQLAHAWAGLDKVRFFDVAETGSGTGHGVIEIVWGRLERDWGSAATAGTEGGRLVGVFRRAETAEADRVRRNRARAVGYGAYRYDRRLGYAADARRSWPARSATFFEVSAIPSDVPPFAGVGYLVQRRALADSAAGGGWRDRPPADARVPVALFAERAAADAFRDQMNTECRQALNPFVFADPTAGAATSFGRAELDHLRLPLPIPAGDRRAEWVEWWDLCQDETTDEQRTAVWGLCDRPLFEVLRVEVGDE